MISFRRLFIEATKNGYRHHSFSCIAQFSSAGRNEEENEEREVLENVKEMRSAPAKGLAALRINEGGNINRADIIGTVTELKMLNRLSKPDQQWATMFVRTRIPILSTTSTTEISSTSDSTATLSPFRLYTYFNRVHVFDRRLLPLVQRTKPGDRIFVTGFVSYYKPVVTSSSPEVAKMRKIGAVVAERMILLGASEEELAVMGEGGTAIEGSETDD